MTAQTHATPRHPFTHAELRSVSQFYGYAVPATADDGSGFSRITLETISGTVRTAAELVAGSHDITARLVGLFLGVHAIALAHGLPVGLHGTSFYREDVAVDRTTVISRLLDDILSVAKARRPYEATLGLAWSLASIVELSRMHGVDVAAVAGRGIRSTATAG